MVRGVGFEPTNLCRIAASVVENKIDFNNYALWLSQNYRPFTARTRLCYAKKYASCLINRDLGSLKMFTSSKREHILKALSALSKYMGMHENFVRLVKDNGYKWSGRNSDDLIIARLLKNVDKQAIFQWIRDVKAKAREVSDLIDFMLVSGLRLVEAIESNNLIIRLDKEGKLDTYYREDKETLEHFRFKDLFIRNSKKTFISFVHPTVVYRLAMNEPLEYGNVQKMVSWRTGKLRFADIRELHNTLLNKYLTQPEIDFLAGRVSTNVFMTNYFNINLVDDVKVRYFKAIHDIQDELEQTLN
jgi:intergrase/recombinase